MISSLDGSFYKDIYISDWRGDSILVHFIRKKPDSSVQNLWIQDLKTGNVSPLRNPRDTLDDIVLWHGIFGYARIREKNGDVEINEITNNSIALNSEEWDSLVVNKTMDTLVYKGWRNWK